MALESVSDDIRNTMSAGSTDLEHVLERSPWTEGNECPERETTQGLYSPR